MKVTCENCGKAFKRKPSRVIRVEHQYCTELCASTASRTKIPDSIDKEILVRLYTVDNLDVATIANKFGLSLWVMSQLFKRYNIKKRTRAERSKVVWSKAPKSRRDNQRKSLLAWNAANTDRLREFAIKAGIASQKAHKSKLEIKFAIALDNASLKYVPQFVVGNKFFCDFGFPEYMLIVECDGIYWHSSEAAQKRDRSKTAYLQKCGYTVMRFTDKQIDDGIDFCINQILDFIKKARKP